MRQGLTDLVRIISGVTLFWTTKKAISSEVLLHITECINEDISKQMESLTFQRTLSLSISYVVDCDLVDEFYWIKLESKRRLNWCSMRRRLADVAPIQAAL